MLKVSSLFSLPIYLSIIFFFTCRALPTNPYEDPKNLNIGCFLKGNKATALQNDSISVGVAVNIPNLSKSLRAVQGDDSSEIFLSLNNPSSTSPDTVYFKTAYKTTGTKTIKIKTVLSDNTQKDFKFEIEVIPGNSSVWKQDSLLIEVQENSSITISLDSLLKNSALSGITFSSDKGTIDGNVWRDSVMWGSAEKDTVKILADYNGIISKMKVFRTVIPKEFEGPQIALVYPAVSDFKVSARNVTCSFNITDKLSGVGSVVFKTGTTILTDTLHSGDNYQCVVKDLVQGEKTILTIEAYDKSMKKTMTSLNVSLTYDPDMADNVLPKIELESPSTLTAVVSTSETSIQVICTDESGIDTVTARMGTTQLTVEHSDSLYSIAVTGLTAGKTDTIVIEATDKSSEKNKAPLSVYITFDASSLDTKGPKITLKSPESNNTKVSSSSITLSVVCSDDNKVASATYKTGTLSGNMTAENDSVFTATIVGLVSGENQITVTAKDKSSNANSSDSVFTVIYEPAADDKPVITVEPTTQSVVYGNKATFSVTATGLKVKYQWYKGTEVITDATLPTYTTKVVSATDDGSTYYCIVSNGGGEVKSSTVSLIVEYRVTYDANGASSGTAPVDNNTYAKGESAKVMAGTGLTRTNFTFGGWLRHGVTNSMVYNTDDSLMISSGNVTLDAVWNADTYTLTYKGNGSTAGSAPASVTGILSGASVTVSDKGSLVKTNCEFLGWSTDQYATTAQYNSSKPTIIINANTTLFAIWKSLPTFSVSYFANGGGSAGGHGSGTVPTDRQEYVYGMKVSVLGNEGNLKRDGYVFGGWSTTTKGDVVTSVDVVSSNILLYAQWLIMDASGNTYEEMEIFTSTGTQVWMTTNLKTTKLNSGAPISPPTEGKASYVTSKYGVLYNGYAVMEDDNKMLAPPGWRVSTSSDWSNLIELTSNSGGAKTIASKDGWVESDAEMAVGNMAENNNSWNFTAYPDGSVGYDGPDVIGVGEYARFWCSRFQDLGVGGGGIVGGGYVLAYNSSSIELMFKTGASNFYSVRCVREY